MNTSYLLGKLTPFANNRKMIVSNQSTGDIIKQIIDTHNKYKNDYDKISDQFWKGNVKNTCEYLFDFLKKNVVYSIEPDYRQSVKSPAAILATGQYSTGGNDCKHYSLFQAGILDSLKRKGKNIDWCYRFANYKLFSTTPHHVFVVVKINGKEYWCDPVLNYWDQKKPYINKIDKKMSLYSISGIGRTRKHRHLGAKIALFPGRKAFLALVRINFDKFAIKLYRKLNGPKRAELLYKWEKLGGKPALLISTVNKAVAKYKRKHPGRSIGAEPLSVTIIATATPIITALLKFLKPEKADEITEASSAVQDSVQNYRDSQQSSADQSQDQSQQSSADQQTVSGVNPYYLYGGLALAGYFLYKNKSKLFR
jgi:hypothetical protein